MAITLEDILSKAEDLPVLPNIAMEILNLINEEHSAPADFENIIENDQVMTLKILKLANSAYYGYPREIVSIKEAIVILGLDTLKSLALSLLTRQILSKGLDTYGLKNGELWHHSMAVGMIARSLAKKLKLNNLEKYYVAGLLHDIGKLLLDYYLQDNVEDLKWQINDGGLEFAKAEENIFGFDHALIGSKLIELWNLPDFLVNIVRYHHYYDNAAYDTIKDAYIINIADRLSYNIARGTGIDYIIRHAVTPEDYSKLGINSSDIDKLLDSVGNSVQSIKF